MSKFLTKPSKRIISFICSYNLIESKSSFNPPRYCYETFNFYLKLPEIEFSKSLFGPYGPSVIARIPKKLSCKLGSEAAEKVNFIPLPNISDVNAVCFSREDEHNWHHHSQKISQMQPDDIIHQFLTSKFTIHPSHASSKFIQFVGNFSSIYGCHWFDQNRQRFIFDACDLDHSSIRSVFFKNAMNFYCYWEHQTKTNPNYNLLTDEKIYNHEFLYYDCEEFNPERNFE